ncbi:MAG TPA: S53 family peptidase, partial [Acidimicrobiales bacterium]|nr:S53 family peptidase [Acidimicrobiales bacterium]
AIAASPATQRRHMTREEFAARFGADAEDLTKVESFAKEHGLVVEQTDAARRVVVLGGTVADMGDAFGVELSRYDHADGSYRGRVGAITIPADLEGVVTSVHGLDDRPAARPHVRVAPAAVQPRQDGGPYSPVEVAAAYDFPTDKAGQGECVAIIELDGGYTDTDMQTFFQNLGIPEPAISSVGVDGGTNNPSPINNADVEVALDIEVVGAVAPGARMAVYFAPNTDQGFLDAITTAVHDTTNAPSIISISWGSAEANWSGQSLQAFDQAFQSAGLMGVTVCCASGDNGSGDGVTDGQAHVDFPASSPNVLACGGTQLSESAGSITAEVVWNEGGGATGGGISDVFDLPAYQSAAGVPPSANADGRVGRGVPDVAGDADPATGYQIVVNGQTGTVGGTSAVAPLWAGLIARINSDLGAPAGLVAPLLYANPAALHDITSGNNGAYQAGPGWDACTGLGSPDGKLVRQALTTGRAT